MRIRRQARQDEEGSRARSIYEDPERAPGADEDDPQRAEFHFTMNMKTGQITERGVAFPDEEVWVPIGQLDGPTGPRVDYSLARTWQSLSEFWRWRR
jgi:hypothetical protein